MPHDTLVDFRTTPAGFEWLDAFTLRAADQILTHRNIDHVVVGPADWYGGNTVLADGTLVGTFDWELGRYRSGHRRLRRSLLCRQLHRFRRVVDPGRGCEVPARLDAARARPLSHRERRTAAGATAWIIAFNARWQVGLLDHGLCDEATVALARDHGEDYLSLVW